MKTEQEIMQRLEELRDAYDESHNTADMAKIMSGMRTLRWVLDKPVSGIIIEEGVEQ